MKLLLALVFISALAVSFVAAQSDSARVGQNSPMPTQDQITNGPVAEYVSDSACTIGWSSRTSGPMTLRYGTDRTKMTQTAEAVASKDGRNYHAQIEGLSPNTRYYFEVLSAGERISGVGTFHTVGQSESPVKSKAVIPQ